MLVVRDVEEAEVEGEGNRSLNSESFAKGRGVPPSS